MRQSNNGGCSFSGQSTLNKRRILHGMRRFAFGNFRVVMGAYIMNAFSVVQYAKTRLLLAEKKQDAPEIEKWRRNLAYWQQYMERKQPLSKEI